MHGVVHTEFLTSDLEGAQKFYGGLFGWQIAAFSAEYSIWSNDDRSSGGGLTLHMPPGTKTVSYIEVEDIKATMAKAIELGGSELMKYEELPNNHGFVGAIVSPDGTPLGLWSKNPSA